MNDRLSCWLGVNVQPRNAHEWDAAISILPVVRGLHGSWQDLHALPPDSSERLLQILPCGKTTYMWPEAQSVGRSTYPHPSASPATRPITSSFSLISPSISSLGTCRASTWKLFFGMTFDRSSL